MNPATSRERALELDSEDPLRYVRDEFFIPTTAQVHETRLHSEGNSTPLLILFRKANAQEAVEEDVESAKESKKCIYMCGNSLGLQPKRTAIRLSLHLNTWSTQGVLGHFKKLDNSDLPTWLDVDERAAEMMAPMVGSAQSEVAVMQTLTANLHLLMAAFYNPVPNGRHKIIIEKKAFPSDHVRTFPTRREKENNRS